MSTNPLPYISAPTKNTAIGVFESNDVDDIFHIVGPGGNVQLHMNADGTIDGSIVASTAVATLTSAQLKALHSTAILLVPAQGAGLYIVPTEILYQFNYVAPAYTNIGSDGDFYVGWGSSVSDVTTYNADVTSYTFAEDTSSQIKIDAVASFQTPLANVVNKPLSIAMLDTFATGNGTLKVGVVYYTVVA